jgi:hypothetical protein
MPDIAALARLPRERIDRIYRDMAMLQCVQADTRYRPLQAACERAAVRFQCAAKTIYSKYIRWSKPSGNIPAYDWRLLCDPATEPTALQVLEDEHTTLPEPFVTHWQSLVAEQQRQKEAPAHVALLRQWRAWARGNQAYAIPGYDTCPPAEADTGMPKGWSLQNLRRHKPSRHARAMIAIGPKAASHFAPPLLTTTADLMPGMFYEFDDLWRDFHVIVPGQSVPCRLLQIHAMDHATTCGVCWATIPETHGEDGTRKRLKEHHMLCLLAHLLGNIGFHPGGCTLIVERGTATIREREEKLLTDLSGGLIKVQRSTAAPNQGAHGMLQGQGGGNPRFKARIESFHNLIHNSTSSIFDFPGQLGSNSRTNKPEQLEAQIKEATCLLAAVGNHPEAVQKLKLPFLPLAEAVQKLGERMIEVNSRTNHEIEGWDKYTVTEWRFFPDDPWRPLSALAALPEATQNAMAEHIKTTPGATRLRKMSPMERWTAGSVGLKKLSQDATAILLMGIEPVETTLARGLFTCSRTLELPELRYEGLITDPEGTQIRVKDGTTYYIRQNILDPSTGYVYSHQDKYLGTVPLWGKVDRRDEKAVQHSQGRKRHAVSQLAAQANKLTEKLARREDAEAEQNKQTLEDYADAAFLADKPEAALPPPEPKTFDPYDPKNYSL